MPDGIGIDLLEIRRLERALERHPRLAERLFTEAKPANEPPPGQRARRVVGSSRTAAATTFKPMSNALVTWPSVRTAFRHPEKGAGGRTIRTRSVQAKKAAATEARPRHMAALAKLDEFLRQLESQLAEFRASPGRLGRTSFRFPAQSPAACSAKGLSYVIGRGTGRRGPQSRSFR